MCATPTEIPGVAGIHPRMEFTLELKWDIAGVGGIGGSFSHTARSLPLCSNRHMEVGGEQAQKDSCFLSWGICAVFMGLVPLKNRHKIAVVRHLELQKATLKN